MLEICEVTPPDGKIINEFVDLPFRLYRNVPQWVPPFRSEMAKILRKQHPFFEHS